MDDRELLELVARAAGIEPLHWTDDGENPDKSCPVLTDGIRDEIVTWNPLEDDGDAFRLAVRLNFDILQCPIVSKQNCVEVCANEVVTEGAALPFAIEVRAPDPYAATRRAIVRAAAAIAQEMTDAQG